MSEKKYAVLTGDIVQSRTLPKERSKALQDQLKTSAAVFKSSFRDSVVGFLGITQGDGWQVALKKPEMAMRLAVFLRAGVKSEYGVDTRISIGIGPVDRLETDNIVESTGLAFEKSGLGLESLKNEKKVRMLYQAMKPTGRLESAESLLVSWLDTLMTPATEKQASLLYEIVLKRKQDDIAEYKGVTQSTVSEGLTAVGWNEVKSILQHFEKYRSYNR